MKVYIVTRRVDGGNDNVVVTSSKKLAEILAEKFYFMDSYEVEEHELISCETMQELEGVTG